MRLSSTEAMKQAAKESYDTGKTVQERMKSISKAYTTQREMSIQEAVSIVLPEIWLRKTSPGVVFANSNLPENRYRILKSENDIPYVDLFSRFREYLNFLQKLIHAKNFGSRHTRKLIHSKFFEFHHSQIFYRKVIG